VDWLREHEDDRDRREEHQVVINWLTPVDYAPQQRDYIGRRQDGTGQWLLDSNEFQSWLNQDGKTLFCPGLPGAGKTIITSTVVDHLRKIFQHDPTIGIAYIYCNFRRRDEQKLADILANLLKQLVQEKAPLPEEVKSLYQRHKAINTRPSTEELLDALKSVVEDYSRTYILVDALDEFQASHEERDVLVSALFTFQAQGRINIFATSRPVPEINLHFEECVSKKIRAQDEDVLRYINGRLSNLRRPRVSKYPDLQEAIRREVLKAAEGMYV
jgi:Cdc6-like AAA superfamily ATPase